MHKGKIYACSRVSALSDRLFRQARLLHLASIDAHSANQCIEREFSRNILTLAVSNNTPQCVYMSVFMCLCLYVNVCLCMCVFVFMCTCVSVYVYVCV